MPRTRTLAQLRDDVLWQADRQGTTLRNDPARVDRVNNQSIAEFREAVSDGGDPYFLQHYTGTLSVGGTDPYHFGIVDLSSLNPSHLRIYGFDIQDSSAGGVWLSLDCAAFRERNDVQRTLSLGNARPRQFFEFERSTVAYAPAADRAYPFIIFYLPVHADLVADSDTFDGMNGWEDWVVFNSVSRLLLRDRDEHLERFQAERQRILQRVIHVARQRQRQGAVARGGNFGFDRRGLGRDRPFGRAAGSEAA